MTCPNNCKAYEYAGVCEHTYEGGCPNPKCSHNTNGRDLDKPCSIEFRPPQTSNAAVEEVGRLLSGYNEGLILNGGDWVTWEFYKDLHDISEHGHIGNAISGSTVYTPKYKQFFIKELGYRLTKLVEEARADMKSKCLEVVPEELEKGTPRSNQDESSMGWNRCRAATIAAIQALPTSNE